MIIIVNLFLPPVAPLITMLMFGNLIRECLLLDRMAETIPLRFKHYHIGFDDCYRFYNECRYFLNVSDALNYFPRPRIFRFRYCLRRCLRPHYEQNQRRQNQSVNRFRRYRFRSDCCRVSHKVGQEENRNNFLIMHAMGPNLAGVFGTAISGGIMLALLGQ